MIDTPLLHTLGTVWLIGSVVGTVGLLGWAGWALAARRGRLRGAGARRRPFSVGTEDRPADRSAR